MVIGKRLEKIASYVKRGMRIADIGTDHGYIPLYLIKEGIAPFAIAMDINAGPLQKAQDNICNNLLGHQIYTRLSDGIRQLSPSEVDCVIIAGMGGRLILRILEQDQEKLSTYVRYILSPHSEAEVVREGVLRLGLDIIDEDMVYEEGHFYPILICEPSESGSYLDSDLSFGSSCLFRYGRFLLERRQSCFVEYIEQQAIKLQQLIERIPADSAIARREELTKELCEIEEVIKWIRKS